MSAMSFGYKFSASLVTNAFSRVGHTFAGCDTKAVVSGATFPDGHSYTMSDASQVTFYAQWTVNTYAVAVAANYVNRMSGG